MKKKLGEILVSAGAVSDADIEAALGDQSAGEPSRLGDLLVATGKLTSAQLARGLAEQYELPYVELPPLPQAVLDLVPLDLQRQFRFVPLRSDGAELSIAMADLANIEVLAILEQQWAKVHVNVAGGDEIDALHATLSGIFSVPSGELPSVAPPISPYAAGAEDLFGSLELDSPAEVPPTTFSPVPVIAPVQAFDVEAAPRPSPAAPTSAPPRAEDLFGDLNLESARTGIAARPPDDFLAHPVARLEAAPEASPPDAAAALAPPVAAPDSPLDPAVEVAEVFPEGSGPLLIGVREGTGPLLDMLMKEVTGPVVDTPFFRDASIGALHSSERPMLALRSPLSDLMLPPPQPTAPVSRVAEAPETALAPAVEVLPDWLRNEGSAPASSASPGAWSGALDHLMPSRLVVGLTRALLARGLVTEEEILAALGQKK